MKVRFLGIILMTFSIFVSLIVLRAPSVKANPEPIYINSDGSITPFTANITTSDQITYSFTGSNYLPIVVNRSNVVIDGRGYTLQALGQNGFSLSGVSNVTIENTIITNSTSGIYLNYSSDNILSGNNITTNVDYAIWLNSSSNDNSISGNLIINNSNGIFVGFSSGNSISGNGITANSFGYGIYLSSSSGNSIGGNTITNNDDGIGLESSSNNSVSGNNLANDSLDGIYLSSSSNSISGNNISNNLYGIWLISSSNNTIYHNNFKNNHAQVSSVASKDFWDAGYPSGGNFWSDYNGTDSQNGSYQNQTGSDGIGDTPYVIDANNTDRYPLMAPLNAFYAGTWNGVAYNVDTVSNSSITDFNFNPSAKTLSFDVTGASGTVGFCRVIIPLPLMWCPNLEDWTVTVNGTLIENRAVLTDANYTYIYFTYNHSTEPIHIQSTNVIPELQPSMLMPLLMATTLMAVAIHKKKSSKSRGTQL